MIKKSLPQKNGVPKCVQYKHFSEFFLIQGLCLIILVFSSLAALANVSDVKCLTQFLEQNIEPALSEVKVLNSNAGRGQPSILIEDANGKRWLLKQDRFASELQTAAEVISSSLYRKLGYTTPKVVIVYFEGKR